jgi:hypothetical protein
MRRDGQTAGGFHDGGEFQLHPYKRETQHTFLLLIITVELLVTVCALVHRLDCDRARDISTEHGHELEFSFGLYACLLRQISPQMSFWQEAQRRAVRISDVVLFKGEQVWHGILISSLGIVATRNSAACVRISAE